MTMANGEVHWVLPLVLWRRWAGHNRWSKVRNVKGARDGARSRLFQRLATMLRAAAREGGPDPALNSQLANVVEQCRAKNMPKASIEAAIQGAPPPTSASRLLYQARAPGGVALLLWVLTSNPRRSQHHVGLILSRYGGTLSDGARHGFEEKGVVRVGHRDAMGRAVGLEGALEVALEAGAQDVCEEEEEEEEEEPGLKFLCSPSSLAAVRTHVEASGLLVLSASVEFTPLIRVGLPPEAQLRARGLLRALRACPDVLRVFHNVQWEPSVRADQ
ncbi:translational activator of cytochrome c oxidase 1 [Pezoporus flaviventris]|uniref:translational activator of cytochrome c oxidase 1 n=1 Tax=Pezoporus flaviventris TaxID=889875 RepID=UPI002AB055CE|nr:translational activator of cytochrome c oxidase 1 [Pezoporus flaviventris]